LNEKDHRKPNKRKWAYEVRHERILLWKQEGCLIDFVERHASED